MELKEDEFEDIGPQLTEHITTFEVRVTYLTGFAESDLDTMIGYIGEIVDAIEADRSLGSAYITNTEVVSSSYSVSRSGEGVTRYCVITIMVEGHRN